MSPTPKNTTVPQKMCFWYWIQILNRHFSTSGLKIKTLEIPLLLSKHITEAGELRPPLKCQVVSQWRIKSVFLLRIHSSSLPDPTLVNVPVIHTSNCYLGCGEKSYPCLGSISCTTRQIMSPGKQMRYCNYFNKRRLQTMSHGISYLFILKPPFPPFMITFGEWWKENNYFFDTLPELLSLGPSRTVNQLQELLNLL